jgi:hypothetical protein
MSSRSQIAATSSKIDIGIDHGSVAGAAAQLSAMSSAVRRAPGGANHPRAVKVVTLPPPAPAGSMDSVYIPGTENTPWNR